jgi:hypothetical protein
MISLQDDDDILVFVGDGILSQSIREQPLGG